MMEQLGFSRDWVWRGWQIRYTYIRARKVTELAQPPLIFLHGFGASIPHWRNNLHVLSEHHTVYAIDLLGFGASKKAFTNYQINLWAELVRDFWQTFIKTKLILVGNSLGSLIALTVAATYSEIPTGLVMINLPDVAIRQEVIPPLLQPVVRTIENIFATPILLKPLFFLVRRPKIIRQWAKFAYYDKNKITDELVDILAAPPHDEGADRAFCALVQAVNQPNFGLSAKTLLTNLNIPILLIWGRQDMMIPVSLASSLAQINPKIELRILEGVGHCPHDECPDVFNNLIISWLNNLRDNSTIVV